MTPLQWLCAALFICAAYQLYLQVCKPEQYEKERERRETNIKGLANAGAAVVRYILKR
jgi:hypothetical protein